VLNRNFIFIPPYLQLPSQLEFKKKFLAVNKIKLAINSKVYHNKNKKIWGYLAIQANQLSKRDSSYDKRYV